MFEFEWKSLFRKVIKYRPNTMHAYPYNKETTTHLYIIGDRVGCPKPHRSP
jgi:predicted SprT family Zn-dependent metalloprotease